MPSQERTNGMTARQKEVLDFIVEHHAAFKICPTSREIAQRFGFRQTAAMMHVNSLIRNGAPISKTATGRLVYHDPSERIPWEDVKPLIEDLQAFNFGKTHSQVLIDEFYAKYPHLKE